MKGKRITLYLQEAEPEEFVLTCPKLPQLRFVASTPGDALEHFWKAWNEVDRVLAELRERYPAEFQVGT